MTRDFTSAFADAKAHARREYPKESCGLIVGGKYVPCENIAAPVEAHREGDPNCDCQLCFFQIDTKVYAKHLKTGKVEMVVHSHPNGPFFPSQADMASQIQTGIAWAIIALDDERAGDPVIWGGDTPIPPVVGREFMHGITDCYSLIRDVYRLGKDELAKQDIEWPFPPIELPDYARMDAWWAGDDDFYEVEPPKLGFVEVDMREVKPGDLFFTSIHSTKLNHAGLLIGGGQILHHLPSRLSRREGSSIWGRAARKWMRYEGPINA